MINYKNYLFTLIITFILTSLNINAQEFKVIDNKGTINTVFKNHVTTTTTLTAPSNPIVGDVWFNNVDSKIKVWDGTNWKKISDTNNLTTNFYNANGSLTYHRVITGSTGSGGKYDLSFNDIGNFKVYTDVNEILSSAKTTIGSSGDDVTITAFGNILLDNNTSITKSLGIGKNLTVDENFQVKKQFIDAGNNAGVAGQILSSTATGTNWIDNTKNKVTTIATEPLNPIEGDIWFDTTASEIKIYDADEPINTNRWKKITDTNNLTENVYTTNGMLTSDRLVTGKTNSFRFTDLTNFDIDNTNYISLNSKGYLDLRATTGINVVNHTRFLEYITVDKGYKDSTGSLGGAGQILSSTSTATKWVDNSAEHIGTLGSIFFAGADGKPTENNNQLFWDNTNNRLQIGSTLSGTNKVTVQGAIRSQGYNNSNGTVGQPSYRFSSDSNTGMYRIAADQLGFSTAGVNALLIDDTQNINIPKNLSVTGTFADTSGDVGTNGQILTSTTSGTNWIDNPALNNWLTTGNSGTTTANFLGTTDDKKMQIRSNNISILEFGRRQTLGLTQPYPDYTDNNQSVVHVRGINGVSALQFQASGTNFYKPMFFTTPNGSFRLKGSSGETDFFEIGSAGPNNQGRLEFVIGDDGDEPIVFKRYDYRGAKFHRELFRVQGSNATQNAKTRFGINLNQQEVPISSNLNTNYNDASFNKANSTFQVVGSISKSIISTDTNFTLTEDHYTLIAKNESNTRTITLPAASSVTGRIYIIKTNWYRGVNLNITYITRTTNTTNSIPRKTTVQLQSDGTDWQQIN
ncbi:hypothetical protein LNI98_05490 [Tenacibaculum dicentrarchi]|nr:hypothetical protein [Tenacibaculum dicentrarchi]MCD8414746.1 hypothetical protein [Tenacibaculum dicentrarchi]MCD8419735.1 hypothetical protein [Tenacibaculum dicentrarchi]MCD8424888.1 hypothetical protein [Tenacibaculum dicentrarchi]MCD8442616.1 hypothetical protein [Tenacibaculum dicentrarchi]